MIHTDSATYRHSISKKTTGSMVSSQSRKCRYGIPSQYHLTLSLMLRYVCVFCCYCERVRVRVIGHLYSALLWDEPIARDAQIWPLIARGSNCFTCHPHTNHTCLYSPAAGHHRPLASTHCTHPWTDGQAELTWVTGYILRAPGVKPRTRSPMPVLTGPGVE